MNDSASWAKASRCYELLEAMDDVNEFELWVESSKYYE